MNTSFFQNTFPDSALKKKLQPDFSIEHEETRAEEGVLLDTFDEELRRSGFILLQTEKQLQLINCKTGKLIHQNGKAKLRCLPEIEAGPVKDSLQHLSKLRAFLPVTSLYYSGGVRKMLDDEHKTVARLHCFTFKRKKRTATMVVDQALRGYDDEHRTLTKAMAALSPQDTTIFKALKIKSNRYSGKPEIHLQKQDPIITTTNTIVATFIKVARQNELGIIADLDTEFLHDYRVSLRKIRSVISLFKGVYDTETTRYLKNEFSSLMQVTGRMRDLDVYLLDRNRYFSMIPKATHEGLHLMFEAFAKERTEQHKLVCKAIESKSYEKRMNNLLTGFSANTWTPGPLAKQFSYQFACETIIKKYNKVTKLAGSITGKTPDETVHKLRIQCKMLRYLMEFFTPLFDRNEVKNLIKSLKKLQDNLGRFNDYSVQQQSLAQFLARTPIKNKKGVKLAESIGALTAILNLLQQQERAKVMENCARFNSSETRAKFLKLFSIKEQR